MSLTIHNLPAHMQYPDIKHLLFAKCGLTELIVYKLVNDGNSKKVTIKMTNDSKAAIIARKINGLFVGGHQLYVEDVLYKSKSDQPFRPQASAHVAPNRYNTSGDHRYQPGHQRASKHQRFDASDSQRSGAREQRSSSAAHPRSDAPKYQKYNVSDNTSGDHRYQPDHQRASQQQRFDASDSQSSEARELRSSSPAYLLSGAPKYQKYNVSDNTSGDHRDQPVHQRASQQQRFDDSDSQRSEAREQRLSSAAHPRSGASKYQKYNVSDNTSGDHRYQPDHQRASKQQRLDVSDSQRSEARELRSSSPAYLLSGAPKYQKYNVSDNTSGDHRYQPDHQRASKQQRFDAPDSQRSEARELRSSSPAYLLSGEPKYQKYNDSDNTSGDHRYQPDHQRASKQQRFDAFDSQRSEARELRSSSPAYLLSGAPKYQKYNVSDNTSGDHRYQPDHQRASKQQRFDASDSQRSEARELRSSSPAYLLSGATKNQKLSVSDNQRFDRSKNQLFGAFNNQMVVASDTQQFSVPAVPIPAQQDFLAPGYMQMPMNMPMMPSISMMQNMPMMQNMLSSSMCLQLGAMMSGSPYEGMVMPQGQIPPPMDVSGLAQAMPTIGATNMWQITPRVVQSRKAKQRAKKLALKNNPPGRSTCPTGPVSQGGNHQRPPSGGNAPSDSSATTELAGTKGGRLTQVAATTSSNPTNNRSRAQGTRSQRAGAPLPTPPTFLPPPPLPGTTVRVTATTEGQPEASRGIQTSGRRLRHSRRHRKRKTAPKADQPKLPDTAKRARLDDTTSPQGHAKKVRTNRIPGVSYADAAQSQLMIAVTTVPRHELRAEELQQIDAGIRNRIVKAVEAPSSSTEKVYLPTFKGKPQYSEGVLKMWCEDQKSLEWLKLMAASFPSPRPNSRLVVIPQTDIVRRARAGVLLPLLDEEMVRLKIATIQRMLDVQNRWANVEEWSIYDAQQQTERGMFLTVGIPEPSLARLLQCNRKMAFMDGTVYVRFFGPGGLRDTPYFPSQ